MFDQTIPIEESIRPYADSLIVRLQKEAEVTEGGVHLPQQSRRTELYAEVMACGPLVPQALSVIRLNAENAIQADAIVDYPEPGDWVVTSPHAGYPITWNGEEYRVVRAVDLFGCMVQKPAVLEVTP